jgi:hypothetical protein
VSKLACPYVSRSGARFKASSAFNEGVQVPQAEFDRLAAKNPALVSKDKAEKYEATKKAILHGELAKFRRR